MQLERGHNENKVENCMVWQTPVDVVLLVCLRGFATSSLAQEPSIKPMHADAAAHQGASRA